jgi:hypothetical protein
MNKYDWVPAFILPAYIDSGATMGVVLDVGVKVAVVA